MEDADDNLGSKEKSSSLLSGNSDDAHQLSLERLLNPGLLFQSVRDSKRSKVNMLSLKKTVPIMTLHQAARDGQKDVVHQHIIAIGKEKKKLNRKDEEQSTALHYAVRYGHFAIVKLLVENGANVNANGEYGATPLHYASRYVLKSSRSLNLYDRFDPSLISRNKSSKSLLQFLSNRKTSLSSKRGGDSWKKKKVSKGLRSFVDLSVFNLLGSPKPKMNELSIKLPKLERKSTIHGSLEDLDDETKMPLLLRDKKEQTHSNFELGTICNQIPSESSQSLKKELQYDYVEQTSKSEQPIVICQDNKTHSIHSLDALILPEICSISSPNSGSCGTVDKQPKKVRNDSVSLPDISVEFGISCKIDNECFSKKKDLKQGKENRFKVQKLSDVPLTKEDSLLMYLLENKANINAKDFYGSTPLHYAAMRGNACAATQLLHQKTIEIELKDRTQMTALHSAASSGSYEVVKLLLNHGSEIRCRDEEDMTPLHFACMEGHLDIVKLLFDVGEKWGGLTLLAKMIMDQDRDEQTALHLAVENGHFEIVKLCIQKGANVNIVKANLITPLHLGCTSGQFDIVKSLIQSGADIEAKNVLQETPLHRAALFNRCAIMNFLLDRGAEINCRDKDKETPLMMAVCKNNVETVKLLLARNADITVKECKDKTCLYLAAQEGCVEVLEILRADVKSKDLLEEFDKNENTPLHVAAMKGNVKVVEMLLEMGACIDAKNEQSLTPLHLAAKYGQAGIVELLLAQDINIVNDEDDASNTPLHLGALEGHVKVVQILLKSSAAVDARNANLWTPLDCAASRGWTWCAEYLLDNDSLIDPVDKAKTTPLHLASKEGHVDMIKLLLSRKANIARKDNLGRNCLDLAIENNQREASLAILDDKNWGEALRNCTVERGRVTTPMRKLIQKLPGVAEKVFNQCIKGNGLPKEHPLYEVTCTYEYLEDNFTDWGPSIFNCKEVNVYDWSSDSTEKGKQESLMQRIGNKLWLPGYIRKQSEFERNHPLKFMVQNERTRLLSHPLVTYLLRHKWRSCGRYVYYSKLTLYVVFLFFLTGYALSVAKDEFRFICGKHADNATCICLPISDRSNVTHPTRVFFVEFGRFIVIVLAVINGLIEFAKLVSELHHYFRLHRAIEFTSYISAIVYILESFTWSDGSRIEVVNNSRCNNWHRSLGAATVWLSWISLVLYMRKFPKLGIYVVMFTDILKTFAQFSMVFALFIIAFGLAFHMLLYEQEPTAFVTPARSILKTTLGMLGEFEYDSVFNGDYNPMGMAWAIYVAYIVINCIILMNLLVGLAVDDIKGVQETAVLKRLAMQVDLTLDVEKALPLTLQRKLVKIEECISPNTEKGWSLWAFWASASPKIMLPETKSSHDLRKETDELKETVRTLRKKMKSIETQNHRIESMLTALIEHHKITVDYGRR